MRQVYNKIFNQFHPINSHACRIHEAFNSGCIVFYTVHYFYFPFLVLLARNEIQKPGTQCRRDVWKKKRNTVKPNEKWAWPAFFARFFILLSMRVISLSFVRFSCVHRSQFNVQVSWVFVSPDSTQEKTKYTYLNYFRLNDRYEFHSFNSFVASKKEKKKHEWNWWS